MKNMNDNFLRSKDGNIDSYKSIEDTNNSTITIIEESVLYRITLNSFEFNSNNGQYEEYNYADPLIFYTNQETSTWFRTTMGHTDDKQVQSDYDCDIRHLHYSHATDIQYDPLQMKFQWTEWGPYCHCSIDDDLDSDTVDWKLFTPVNVIVEYGKFKI